MRRFALVLGLVFVAALAGAEEKFVEKKVVASLDADGVQRLSVLAGEYFFDPNVIVVKANVPVELAIRKEPGITPHDISLKAPEAGLDIKTDLSSEPKIIRFTATKPGTYPFVCEERFLFFKSHKDRGMHGVLEVVAQDQGSAAGGQGPADVTQGVEPPVAQPADQPSTTKP